MILSFLQHNLKSCDTNAQNEYKYETNQSDILFSTHKIDIETTQQIKEQLINQKQLLKLKLIINHDNKLQDILMICEQLSLYNKILLLQIIIQENQVNLDNLQILCENFKSFNNLKKLKIKLQQQIKENDLDHQKTLYQLNQLIDLSLSFEQNQIQQHIINNIAVGIKQLNQLLSLSLKFSQNQINQEGAILLGLSLKNLINLKQFSLQIASDNNLNSEGALGIGERIKYLINLENLSISIGKNNIKQIGVNALLNSLKYLENLLSLSLAFDQNQIGDESFISFKENIVCYHKLQELSIKIQDNTIDKKLIQYLSIGLIKMQQLSSLSIIIAMDFKFDIIYQFLNIISNIQRLECFEFQIDLQYSLSLYKTLLIQETILKLINIELLELNIPTRFIILSYKEIQKSKQQIKSHKNLQTIGNIKNLIKLYERIGKDSEDLKQLPKNIRIQSDALLQNIGMDEDINQILQELTNIQVLKFKLNQSFHNMQFILFQSFRQLTNLVELNLTISIKIKYHDLGFNDLTNLQVLKVCYVKDSKLYFYHSKLVNLVHLSIEINTDNVFYNHSFNNLGQSLINLKKLQIFELKINPFYQNTQDQQKIKFFEYLEKLSSLKQLNLLISKCDLVFVNTTELGQALKKLIQIEKLSISIHDCSQNSICAKTLSDAISQFTQLSHLKIDFEQEIFEQSILDMFKNIQNLANLSTISITFPFSLEENEVIAIIKCLENSPNLIQLELIQSFQDYLQFSNFSNKCAIELGNILKELKHLKELNLVINENKIQWDGWINLAKGIISLVQLNKLKLSLSNCDVQFAKILGDNIHLFTNLNILEYQFSLDDNFSGQYLSKCLQYQINLTELSFSLTQNSITDQGMAKIGQALKHLLNLNKLTIVISQNQIKPLGFIGLSEGLKHLINLKYLSLEIQNGNQIDEIGKEQVGLSLENLQNLETLQLKLENLCFNSNLKQLFIGISTLVNLKDISLTIQGDTLPERIPQQLYESLKKIKSLEKIEIDIQVEENYIFLSLLQFLPRLNNLIFEKEYPNKINFKRQNNLIDGLDDKQIIQLSFEIQYGRPLLNGIDLALSNFIYIQQLDIVFNDIANVQPVKLIFQGVKHLKLLRHFSFIMLYYNNNYEVIEHAVSGIIKLSNLNINSLVIQLQDIQYKTFERLVFQGIAHLKNLFYLSLKVYHDNKRYKKSDIYTNSAFKRLIKFEQW